MLTIETRRMLYNAAIASRMGYCDMIWDACGVQNKNKLQTVQNRCARRILNKLPGTSSAPLLKELGWIPLEVKRRLHKCVMLHKLLNGRGPEVLINMLNPLLARTNINTRGAADSHLFLPRYNTDYAGRSFFNSVARLWNDIPLDLRNISNSLTFKEKLQKYYVMEYRQDRPI